MKLTYLFLLLAASGASPCFAHKTGVVFNDISDKHSKIGHPESALRTQAILKQLKMQRLWPRLQRLPTRAASDAELTLVHTPAYLREVKTWANGKASYLYHEKWSPYRSPRVLESARTAAGSLIDLVYAVADGKMHNGFALIRPPGHHASSNHGMGFCIYNNVAIAARAVRQTRHLERIAIVDIDAHHGNGTQSIFATDPNTLYISFHQFPFWPFSGAAGERGVGNIMNLPLAFQSGDAIYKSTFDTTVRPALEKFHPAMILVSAGYDGHWMDFMSNLGLSLRGLAKLSEDLISVAETTSQGKIIFALEGGYDLDALAGGAANTVKALLGDHDFQDPLGPAPF